MEVVNQWHDFDNLRTKLIWTFCQLEIASVVASVAPTTVAPWTVD